MKDEKKVKAPEEEAKKEVKTEEKGTLLTDEQMAEVNAAELPYRDDKGYIHFTN